jgi:pimeloyl-ACP methyl ester carboxylesterase
VALLATRAWGAPAGDRPLALLLHGITSSSRTWWRVGPALVERGFGTLAVDLRGHGASPTAPQGVGLADLATDVAETVPAVLPGRPSAQVDLLVGHSLGALVALELLRRSPGLARRLVVEDPPGPGGIDWAALADGVEADAARAKAEPEALRRELEAETPTVPEEAERRLADLADCDGRAVAAAVRGGIAFDLAGMLASVRAPALLLLGEEALGSSLGGPDRTAAVAALDGGTVRVLPAGHNLHREALPAWLAALDGWLAGPGRG